VKSHNKWWKFITKIENERIAFSTLQENKVQKVLFDYIHFSSQIW